MTLDECRGVLAGIRRRQGTRWPVVRVDADGSVLRGRVIHADSDPDSGHDPLSPFGTITIAPLGLASANETILQIAALALGSISDHQVDPADRYAPLAATR